MKNISDKETKELTPYDAFELVDEEQIASEIEGRVDEADINALVYSFPDKETGKEVTGLSWKGTKAAWWEFNKRKYTDMSITENVIVTPGEGYIDVAVYAFDKKRNIGAWGMARGYNKMRQRDGTIVEDKFASAKAMSKAQRNALNQLLPTDLIARMIKNWIKQGKVKQVSSQASHQSSPTNGKASMKQVNYINYLCNEKGIDREELKAKEDVESMKDLTLSRAKTIIDSLLKLPNVSTGEEQ